MKWSFSWVIQIFCKKASRNIKDKRDIGDQLCNTIIFRWINCGSERGNVMPGVTQPRNVEHTDTQWQWRVGEAQGQSHSAQGLGLSFVRIPFCWSTHAYQEFNQEPKIKPESQFTNLQWELCLESSYLGNFLNVNMFSPCRQIWF